MKSLALYRGSVFLVAFAGVLSLAPSQETLAGPLGFLVISAGLWWVRSRAGLLPARSPRSRLAADAVAAGIFVLALGLGPTPLQAILHGSILLQAFRFFTASRPAHYVEVLLLALGHLLWACAQAPTPLLVLNVLFFLAPWVLSLVLFHLVEDSRNRIARLPSGRSPLDDPLEREIAEGRAGTRILVFAGGFALSLVPLAAVLFLLLPRPPSPPEPPRSPDAARRRPARAAPADDPGARTPERPFSDAGPGTGPGGEDGLPAHPGFSGEIDLATWGTLFESEREVIAAFPSHAGTAIRPDPDSLYLKGIVFDRFDGRRWTRGDGRLRAARDADDGRADGRVSFERFEPSDAGVVTLEVQARREFGPVRFHATRLLGIDSSAAWVDSGGALWARPEGLSELEIEVYRVHARPIDLRGPKGEALRASGSTAPDTRYLELPPGCERVAELAREAEAPGASPWVNAQRFLLLLRGRCAYSREPYVPPADRPPLDEFLFVRRAGHCELFASALAVMLRSRGVAARVVGGFRGGEVRVDPMDAPYVAVRESDAHAWVEAWFDSEGWLPLDPTPGSGPDAETGWDGLAEAEVPGWMGRWVRYGREDRRALLHSVSSGGLASAASAGRRALAAADRVPRPLLAAAVLAAGAAAAVWASRRRRRREASEALGRPVRPGELRSLGFYAELLAALRARGFAKAPARTPLEFAEEVARAAPEIRGVAEVTELLYRVRFRGDAPTAEELADARAVARAIRSSRSSVPPR
jgi:hypothetical protein